MIRCLFEASKLPVVFLVFPAAQAIAEVTRYSDLSLPKAETGEAIVLILLCIALAASFFLFELVRVKQQDYVEKNVLEERFNENSRRFSINGEERRLLRLIAQETGITDINELFSSLPAYEKGVDHIVASALATDRDEAELLALEDLLQSLRKKMHYGILEQGQPLISTRNLSPGQNVWMLGPRKTIQGEALVSLVRELFFSVKLTSAEKGRMLAFESPVRMAFTRKADGIYGIEVPLVSFDPSSETVKCRHTLSFKRNQLRQDVRVETDLAVSIKCIASEKGRPDDTMPFMVKLCDISGGGCAFISQRQLGVGDTVLVTSSSPKLTIAGVQAKVLAVSRHKGAQHFLYHTRFINIEFEKKEKIVKYVFTRLREFSQR
ncbi:MAG: PilZ domain-containing protein [Chitinispirillaceae bacterium]|nr:PilZ domain-containing protein [Chitinispirillaceae bacterium]